MAGLPRCRLRVNNGGGIFKPPATPTRKPLFRSAHPPAGKPRYTTRYVYADTTLSTHGGSAGDVRITGEERTRLQQMADFLERCCNDLDTAGYEVISIAPILSGRTAYTDTRSTSDYPGHGYSVTDGLIVTGRLKSQSDPSIAGQEVSVAAQSETPDPISPYRQPGLAVHQYSVQARQYLEQSSQLLAMGKLPDASGHGWAAAAWMFKAVAEAQGWQYRHDDEILDIVRRAQQKSGNSKMRELNTSASMLLTFSGMRKRYLQADDVSNLLDQMAELLDILEPLTEPA